MTSRNSIEDKIKELTEKDLIKVSPRTRIGPMEKLGAPTALILTHPSKSRIVFIPENLFGQMFDNKRNIPWESYLFGQNIFPIYFTELAKYFPDENSRNEFDRKYIRNRKGDAHGIVMPLALGIEKVYSRLISD